MENIKILKIERYRQWKNKMQNYYNRHSTGAKQINRMGKWQYSSDNDS